MEFIKTMKKREFIEMTLKTIAAVLAAFIAIILMEAMIYGITINAYTTKGSGSITVTKQYDAYAIKQEDDKYILLYHNVDNSNAGWSCASSSRFTKEEVEAIKADARNLYYGAPNAFTFSITPVHYAVMFVFVAIVGGYFVFRFVKLSKEYKQIEKTYETTGTIEIENK